MYTTETATSYILGFLRGGGGSYDFFLCALLSQGLCQDLRCYVHQTTSVPVMTTFFFRHTLDLDPPPLPPDESVVPLGMKPSFPFPGTRLACFIFICHVVLATWIMITTPVPCRLSSNKLKALLLFTSCFQRRKSDTVL